MHRLFLPPSRCTAWADCCQEQPVTATSKLRIWATQNSSADSSLGFLVLAFVRITVCGDKSCSSSLGKNIQFSRDCFSVEKESKGEKSFLGESKGELEKSAADRRQRVNYGQW